MSDALPARSDFLRRCARGFDRVLSHWIRNLRPQSPVWTRGSHDPADRRPGPGNRQRPERDN